MGRYTIKLGWVLSLLLISFNTVRADVFSVSPQVQDTLQFKQYSGLVVDATTNDELVFATISIDNTNISSITNTEGEFAIKIPDSLSNRHLAISFLGYQKKILPIASLREKDNIITLEPISIALEEIDLVAPKDALTLVKQMLNNSGLNYLDQPVRMTAFYRETIRKRSKNASLAEAVAYIYKQPNSSPRKDIIDLYKSRKSSNYSRLDTVALKLQGGPFTPLYVDLMKYPEYIFDEELISYYDFSYLHGSTINGKPVYVIGFKQKEWVEEPLFYGKLYIDSSTKALASAVFNLNVEDRDRAGNLLVRQKPRDILVYPTEASYRVDYRIKEGKWYYGYGNVQLAFVVNRKGKLFNSKYYVSSEMAITDWYENGSGKNVRWRDRMKPSIIIADEASGFSDPEFWGAYNVIEPEKSIKSAIDKIQRQLKRDKS